MKTKTGMFIIQPECIRDFISCANLKNIIPPLPPPPPPPPSSLASSSVLIDSYNILHSNAIRVAEWHYELKHVILRLWSVEGVGRLRQSVLSVFLCWCFCISTVLSGNPGSGTLYIQFF
ncbi:hypothetical protein LOAG_09046 [Loa loa]|uniref:Uncharacterized protein n=1 Tax=Loa loa TaxID=7209 RepID=A0A1S0TU28_LOALO|nr:hypothetical protein LOAG_09046 [Loa loa]EFO19446.1 hypothetical protein LOAG_09046 [Loa loa]